VLGDITNPRLIYAKGFLFLLTGLLASALLVVEHPDWKTVLLLAIAVWCFARFYYFAFYVIEHYVDPTYKFAGLWSFARYFLGRRRDRDEVRGPPAGGGPGGAP
jgi:hypothetical protein